MGRTHLLQVLWHGYNLTISCILSFHRGSIVTTAQLRISVVIGLIEMTQLRSPALKQYVSEITEPQPNSQKSKAVSKKPIKRHESAEKLLQEKQLKNQRLCRLITFLYMVLKPKTRFTAEKTCNGLRSTISFEVETGIMAHLSIALTLQNAKRRWNSQKHLTQNDQHLRSIHG